jgi:hypothetical protein
VLYRYLASNGAKIGLDSEGREIVAFLRLAILENGEYRVRYTATATQPTVHSGPAASPTIKERAVHGRFQSVDTVARFIGFGNAAVVGRDGGPALALTASVDLGAPGLAGRELIFTPVVSAEAPMVDMDACATGQ